MLKKQLKSSVLTRIKECRRTEGRFDYDISATFYDRLCEVTEEAAEDLASAK